MLTRARSLICANFVVVSGNKLSRNAYVPSRAGEMIPEVEGTRPWGHPRKRVAKCLKGPKTTYTTIAIAEKQSKRSKKGPFSLYIGPTLVLPRKWNLWGPEGKVPPGPPVSPAMVPSCFNYVRSWWDCLRW